MMKRLKGFTFVELLMVLAIVSALVMLSQSDFLSLIDRQKSQTTCSQLLSSLAFAKSEAVKRQIQVHICGLSKEQDCSCDWSQGYQVFYIHQNKKALIRTFSVPENILIDSRNQPMITFSSDGRSLSRATLHIRHHETVQKIVIYDSGRTRVESPV